MNHPLTRPVCTVLLAAALLSPAAHAAETVESVTVRAVAHFDFDSTTMHPEDQARLLADVTTMKNVNWQSVRATGHTDSVGTAAYNDRLAVRRAAAVKAYLADKGLPPALVRTAGAGLSQPVAGNDTATGRAQNRRTEVVFEGVRTQPR